MAQNIIPSGYGGGNSPLFGENMSKSSIAQRRKLANALIAEAIQYQASPHWATAIAKGLQGLVGGYESAQADQADAERSAAISEVSKRLSPEQLMQASFQYDEPGLMEMGQFQQRQQLAQDEADARAAEQRQDQTNWQAKYDQDANQFERKLAADVAAAGVPKASDVLGVVKDYGNQPGVKRYNEVYPTIQSMHKSLGDKSAIADLDFVYGVAKILDPESVVREGEQLLVRQTQSMPAQIAGMLNKVITGEAVLDPSTRASLYTLARRRAGELYGQGQSERQFYLNFGKPYGIGEEQLRQLGDLPPEVAVPPQAAPQPAPATRKTRSGVTWGIE